MKFAEERELLASAGVLRQTSPVRVEHPRLRDYLRTVSENRWPVLAILALALLVGWLVTVTMRPVYQANLLIQIADAAGPSKSILGEAANVFDIKTPATAEMEIMRSRMVIGPAAEKHQLLIDAQPRRFPLLGNWFSPRDAGIDVRRFDVPAALEGRRFTVKADEDGRYTLHHSSLPEPLQGKVGELLEGSVGNGRLALLVSQLQGRKGAEFTVVRNQRGKVLEDLQDSLKLVERGRQSGIIEATVRDTDPVRAADLLNSIGANYVRQDLDRKSAEAERSIAFLNSQMPALKEQMTRAEDAYIRFRSRKGSVSPQDEAKIALERTAGLRGRLADAQQRRRDLLLQYGAEHPSVRMVDDQISGLQGQMRGAQGAVSEMPATQQDAVKLERDAKLSGDLYQQLRNGALQLQLVREGRTGNARVIDAAVPPDEPVRPKAPVVLGLAAAAGAVLSLMFAFVRSGLARGVKSARDIEAGTGLNVYSSAIPMSKLQSRAQKGGRILALDDPSEQASVGLRQLRTVLQHQMRDRGNNRLLITGPVAGVGVHFIGANLAAILAAGGRRVLLIDADLRRGSLSSHFGMERAPGLAELVAGSCTRKQVAKPTGIPRLDLVAAGSTSIYLDSLATSPAFQELLDHASKEYDVVLITAPPVLHSAETLAMVSAAGMVVLVARARKTPVDEIGESARRLSQAGQFPSGVVLNGV